MNGLELGTALGRAEQSQDNSILFRVSKSDCEFLLPCSQTIPKVASRRCK